MTGPLNKAVLRAALVTLVMPPTGFVVLIVIGLLLPRKWQRVGHRLTCTSAIALILLGMPLVSYSMLLTLEVGLSTIPPADHPPEAIIILGGDVIRASEERLGVRPGLLTLDRLRTAVALQRRTGLPILVTGGQTQAHAPAVGFVMEQCLQEDFRVPARWVEVKSVDTWENARFSAAILTEQGILQPMS